MRNDIHEIGCNCDRCHEVLTGFARVDRAQQGGERGPWYWVGLTCFVGAVFGAVIGFVWWFVGLVPWLA